MAKHALRGGVEEQVSFSMVVSNLAVIVSKVSASAANSSSPPT
jgi:hypothetical protein